MNEAEQDKTHKLFWGGKIPANSQTGLVVEGSNKMNLHSPIFQQFTTSSATGNQQQQQQNYLPGFLNVNQSYQDSYSTTPATMLPFVTVASSTDVNPIIFSSVSSAQTVDEKLALLKTPVKPMTTSGPSRNISGLIGSSRKVCADFPPQNQPNNHFVTSQRQQQQQQQHVTCYDYGAIGTRFALLIESLKSSLAKNAPNHLMESSKSLTDTIQFCQQQATTGLQHQGASISSDNSNTTTIDYLERHQLKDNIQHLASFQHLGQQSSNLQGRYISDDNCHLTRVEQGLNGACLSQDYVPIKINQTNHSTTSNSSTSSSPRD